MNEIEERLPRVLARVSRPGRYCGHEHNAVHKEWGACAVRMVFAFPDVYEVGMSHLGGRILYGLVNQHPDWLMERTFAPWPDMEQAMREEALPLYSLESFRPVREFDVVGFSLQYELCATNVLNMLDLAGIPLLAAQRGDADPLVIAGGPVCYNPEPMAPFFDACLVGDGEEVLPEFLAAVARGRGRPRAERLRAVADIEGVYVPSLYRPEYQADGSLAGLQPLEAGVPGRVRRRVVKDLDAAYFPLSPLVPYLDIVHDRAVLEVMRGCQRGCRFCQAGMVYRPVRERRLSTLLAQAGELLAQTGYDEITLASLSTADYSRIQELVTALVERHGPRGVGVSLPSLRADAFSVHLADQVQRVRKTTLTFAPEAGTQRLRDAINKNVSQSDLLGAVRAAFDSGWQGVKLYFMVGLPGETREDLDGIAEMLKLVRDSGRERAGKRLRITASISNFVPKAHTPFQWEAQVAPDQLRERHEYLRQQCRGLRGVSLDFHQPEPSLLEGVLARGDRRLAAVIYRAWQAGCKFDGWREYLRMDAWAQAFAAEGLDPQFYALRRRPLDERMPWEVIDTGLDREFLQEEYERSRRGEVTPDCRQAGCVECGVCPNLGVALVVEGDDGAPANRV